MGKEYKKTVVSESKDGKALVTYIGDGWKRTGEPKPGERKLLIIKKLPGLGEDSDERS